MKIIRKRKNSIYNFLLTVFLSLLILASAAGITSQAAKPVSAAGTTATVRIVSDENTWYAFPEKDGTIYFRIEASNILDDVMVYYRTVDGSAIAKENYDEIPSVYGGSSDSGKLDINGRITLNPGQRYKELSVKTKPSEYLVKGSTYYYPRFFIEIYAVTNATVESGKGNLTCYVNSNHWYSYSSLNGGYVFDEYVKADISDNRTDISSNNPITSPIIDNDFKGGKYLDWFLPCSMTDSNKQKIWENDFIQTDLASAFFATDFYVDELNTWWYSVADVFVKYYADYTGPSTKSDYQGSYVMSNWYDCKNMFATVSHNADGGSFSEYRTLVGFSFDEALDIIAQLFPDEKRSELSATLANCMVDYGIKNAKIKKKGGDDISNYYLYSYDWFYGLSADNTLFVPYNDLMGRGFVKNNFYNRWNQTYYEGDLIDFWNYVEQKNSKKAIDEFVNFFDDGIAYANCILRAHKTIKENTDVMPGYFSKIFFQIPKGDLNICLQFTTDTKLEKQYKRVVNSYILEDITAPTVKKVSGTDRNFDESVGEKSKTRVSVQFSEPVYIKQSDIDAGKVKLNGNVTLAGGDKRAVQLSYSGGSGTDTLYFDFDKSNSNYVKEGDNIQGLVVTEISGANCICDFAYHPHHPTNSFDEEQKITCVYDHRKPVIKDITGDGSTASISPQKVQVMKINTRDISDTGFIYYAWSEENISTAEAKTKLTFTKTRVTGDHTQVKIQDGNGVFYLYAYAESALKIKSDGVAKGSTVLDNSEPKVLSISDSTESTARHTFKLKMQGFEGENCAELGKVYLLYSPTVWYSSEEGGTPFKGEKTLVYDIDNYELNKLYGTSEYDDKKESQGFDPNTIKVNVGYANVGLTKAGWSFVGFCVVDAAGNESTYLPYGKRVVFTTAETFNADAITKTDIASEPKLSQINDLYVYDTSIGEIKFRIPTKINDYDIEKDQGKLKVSVNLARVIDDNTVEEYEKCVVTGYEQVKVTTDDEGKQLVDDEGNPLSIDRYVITIPLTDDEGKQLMDGCYKYSFKVEYYDQSVKKTMTASSNEFVVYLYNNSTPDKTRQTDNYGDMRFRNGYVTRIYVLDSEAQYCYLNSTTSSNCSNSSCEYVSYCGEKEGRLIFSSREKAREYLIYKEYQDLAALKITPSVIERFQEGTTYKVATEDKAKASDSMGNFKMTAGDYWIRYKRSNWQQGSTSDWVYYYYGASYGLDTLDAKKLTDGTDCRGLQQAIEEVVDRILNTYGSYSYVHTSYYEDDTIDEYYTPRFSSTQIHPDRETTPATLGGTNLVGFLMFSGDGDIYSDDVVSDSNYSYVSNYSYTFKTNEITRIFYKVLDDGADVGSVYELLPTNGKYNLKDLPQSYEKYMVYECTEKGFYSYPVFVDREAPKLNVRYLGKNGWVESKEAWDKEYADGLAVYSKTFQVLSISDRDEDYSYVAVFKKGGFTPSHVVTYTAAELRNGANLVLNEDGTYMVEVLDRSGNMYTVLVRIRTDEIETKVTEFEDRYVRFSVPNREESEVELFEVRVRPLDAGNVEGRLVQSAFNAGSFAFTESGHYTFYLLDRYNNESFVEYDFERNLPNVSIRYRLNEVDSFSTYDSKKADQPLVIGGSEDEVDIYTRAQLAFAFSTEMNYNVRFITAAAEGIDYTFTNNAQNTVLTILMSAEFYSFEVSYSEYNYIKKVYNVYVDKDAPNVKLAYDTYEYEYDDVEYFKKKLKEAEATGVYEQDENVYLEAPSVNFKVVGTRQTEVMYGAIVSAPYFDLTLPDKAGLKYFKITRDDKIVAEVDGTTTKIYKDGSLYKVKTGDVVRYYESGRIKYEVSSDTVKVYDIDRLLYLFTYTVDGNEITLFERGVPVRVITREVNGYINNYYEDEVLVFTDDLTDDDPYKIVGSGYYDIYVEDVIGNKSSFVFTKANYEIYHISVDGQSDKNYGKDSLLITVSDDCGIAYTVEYDGNLYYYSLMYEDKQLKGIEYKIRYLPHTNENGEPVLDEDGNVLYGFALTQKGDVSTVGDPEYVEPLLDGNLSTFKHDYWYYDEECDLYLMINSAGELLLRFESNGEHEVYLQTRVTGLKVNRPVIYDAFLSQKESNVSIKDVNGEDVETNSDGKSIYLNRPFKVASVDEDVVSVKIYYSMNPSEYTDGKQIYKRGSFSSNVYCSDKGYYKVEIENLYGNVNEYYVIVSDTFNVSVTAHYADVTDNFYNFENELEVFRSNSSVEIETDSGLVKSVKVSKKDSFGAYSDYGEATVIQDERTVKVVLSEEGEYRVVICDEYGNVWDRKVEILRTALTMDDDVLTGWNEKALKLGDGYTNTKLSVDLDLMPETVKFLGLYCGDGVQILYDEISQETVPYNKESFENILGGLGDGEYHVIFRDAYGNAYMRNVHYSGTTTLSAVRKTRVNQEGEAYSDELLRNGTGLWTNSAFVLSGSVNGILKVNGEVVASPYEKSALQEAIKSHVEYTITYLDEYGFEYSFTAYISREEVEMTVDKSVNILETDDEKYTRDNLIITFKDKISCKYYLGGAGPFDYQSGDVLDKDGDYTFVLEDLAGNTTSYRIKRDTVCNYAFVETDTERRILNGDVVNNLVRFENGDGEKNFIKVAVLNGKMQDVEDLRLNSDGKWELLISDNLGNVSYFSFYLITHELNGFKYTTPYGYTIDTIMRSYKDVTENVTSHEEVSKVYDGELLVGNKFEFSESGEYSVVMSNDVGETVAFDFTIDLIAPKAELINATDGGITKRDVSFSDLKIGDTIDIYKNGKLVNSVLYSYGTEAPVISDAGEYKVVVKNLAGNEKEFNFTRKHVVNTAGSVLIIVVNLTLAIALLVGIVYRTKNKTDK